MMRTIKWISPAALVLASGAACTDATTGRLTLALTATRPNPVLAVAASTPFDAPRVVTAGDTTVITLGNDTIILRSVEVVLLEIELKRVEALGCDSVSGNDDCEEFETGP